MPRVHAIVLASGAGARFGGATPKQYVDLAGRPVLLHSLTVFDAHPRVSAIRVVVDRAERERAEEILDGAELTKLDGLIDGGDTRQASSQRGVEGLPSTDAVLIHDAVRPFVTPRMIDDCLDALADDVAVTVAVPSPDTVVEVDAARVVAIPDRRRMMLVQTPQAFRVETIQLAHRRYRDAGDFPVTDDCGLVSHLGLAPIRVVPGDPENLKITYSVDLERAADRIRRRRG